MEKVEYLFESYNRVVGDSYERFFKKIDSAVYSEKLNSDDFYYQLDRDISEWLDTPAAGLEGQSPSQYINSISDYGQVLEMFKLGAKVCDEDVPGWLLDKLRTFGAQAEEDILGLAADRSLMEHEEESIVQAMAIKTLGEWRVDKAVGPLIDLITLCSEKDELTAEAVSDALANIGEASADSILQVLEGADEIGFIHEYLFSALTKIGERNKPDRITRCLKRVFQKMDNKVFGAACLGDYGDGRLIPALRGYVEKNMDNIDEATFYEIKHAVERMGGNMDDMELETGDDPE